VRKKFIFQVNGTDYLLGEKTWIMGILNITPDSFSDGGLYLDKNKAVKRGLELIEEGTDIIDIGGESTRPQSDPVTVEEELKRVIPVIAGLREKTDSLISIDTTKAKVAEEALDAGADIINDISAFRFDPEMLNLATQRDVPVILMHMQGNPKNMQNNPHYEDVLSDVRAFLAERVDTAKKHGIKKEKIIIDPGIGFGKRLEDNLVLLNNLDYFEDIGQPLLVGVSRKSFMGKILDIPAQERLEGTIASSVLSIKHGAHILRVHDVASIKKAVTITEAIINEIPDSGRIPGQRRITARYDL
jgi:dihydropteroate synthase